MKVLKYNLKTAQGFGTVKAKQDQNSIATPFFSTLLDDSVPIIAKP